MIEGCKLITRSIVAIFIPLLNALVFASLSTQLKPPLKLLSANSFICHQSRTKQKDYRAYFVLISLVI